MANTNNDSGAEGAQKQSLVEIAQQFAAGKRRFTLRSTPSFAMRASKAFRSIPSTSPSTRMQCPDRAAMMVTSARIRVCSPQPDGLAYRISETPARRWRARPALSCCLQNREVCSV